ncbi:MAG: enoyl-CoA hydratase/isomerase family protein [Chitinophagales bacterium]
MNFNNIIVEKQTNILYITINRPKNLNALNSETISELSQAIDLVNDDKEIRAAILTGAGEKAFVAGADIKEFASFNVAEGKHLAANGQAILFDKIEQSQKPFIACVNGYALGGGCELAMACHIRIASPNAMFGLPEVSLGLIPGYGGTQRLVQLVGKGKALQMLMTAEMVKAEEALDLGLVTDVVAFGDLKETAEKLVKKISKNAPLAVAKAIQAVNAFNEDGVDGFKKEIELFGECFDTKDFVEGTTAFIEKRKAEFKGK